MNIGNTDLPLVTGGTLQPVSSTAQTVVRYPDAVLASNSELAAVSITIPPNALYSENGTRRGRIGIGTAPVPADRLPGPLPRGLNRALVITVQPDGGANLDQPVPACFPKMPDLVTKQALPPGAKAGLISFNHDIGHWDGRLMSRNLGEDEDDKGPVGKAARILTGHLNLAHRSHRHVSLAPSIPLPHATEAALFVNRKSPEEA